MNFSKLAESFGQRSLSEQIESIRAAPGDPAPETVLEYRLDKTDFRRQEHDIGLQELFGDLLLDMQAQEAEWSRVKHTFSSKIGAQTRLSKFRERLEEEQERFDRDLRHGQQQHQFNVDQKLDFLSQIREQKDEKNKKAHQQFMDTVRAFKDEAALRLGEGRAKREAWCRSMNQLAEDAFHLLQQQIQEEAEEFQAQKAKLETAFFKSTRILADQIAENEEDFGATATRVMEIVYGGLKRKGV